ncbi:hypothetical protein HU200_061851 [Digitaria exilis]|uniref:Thaumatin-like protein n=1 Tax=Digitaria exilis TaxID=1010633 RepID=A0A835DW30_9POAL|nr:hypothetical protein HU200_061851 [Digitaria exilis]
MATCSFTISNYCSHPIWPATLAGAGTPQLSTTGFRLDPGQTVQVPAPTGWSGRLWARTGCVFDAGGDNGTCQTGDCGGRMECSGTGATPPATLFEITLGKVAGDLDYYDVSLVDGYNLPVLAVPRAAAGGGCNATGCMADLNRSCPKELQVERGGDTVACRSACEAFGKDEYCCSGAYATPTTCRPTAYSSVFKSACPRAYSYAYDDRSSTFTCSNAAGYTIAFCLPPSGSLNSGDVPVGSPPAYGQSTSGGTSGSSDSTPPPGTDTNGVGSTTPPPPATDNNGGGSGNTYPPPPTTDNNGGGSGSTYQPPASTDNNGFGSTDQPPPPAASYGDGSTYDQPPWMTLSSASTLHKQLWLLLPAVLLFLLWSLSP